jgi:hypothetical protein
MPADSCSFVCRDEVYWRRALLETWEGLEPVLEALDGMRRPGATMYSLFCKRGSVETAKK